MCYNWRPDDGCNGQEPSAFQPRLAGCRTQITADRVLPERTPGDTKTVDVAPVGRVAPVTGRKPRDVAVIVPRASPQDLGGSTLRAGLRAGRVAGHAARSLAIGILLAPVAAPLPDIAAGGVVVERSTATSGLCRKLPQSFPAAGFRFPKSPNLALWRFRTDGKCSMDLNGRQAIPIELQTPRRALPPNRKTASCASLFALFSHI